MVEEADVRHGLEVRVKVFKALYRQACDPNNVPIDSITVKDICTAAGISRPTFYYYFQDKYDVISWFMQMIGQNSIAKIGESLGVREGLTAWVDAIEDYRDFFSRCQRSRYYSDLYTHMMPLLRGPFTAAAQRTYGTELPHQVAFDIRYYCIVLERAAIDWLEGKLDITGPELVDYLVDFVPRSLASCLEVPSQKEDALSFLKLMGK